MTVKASLAGTRDSAEQLQKVNSVQARLCGPWYHGTTNSNFNRFTADGGAEVFLTRSQDGGKADSTHVLEIYVIADPNSFELSPAGAGDDGGTDPNDPRQKRSDWWLKIPRDEVDCLMVVATRELPPRQTLKELKAQQAATRQATTFDRLLNSDWAKQQNKPTSGAGDA